MTNINSLVDANIKINQKTRYLNYINYYRNDTYN